MTLTHIGVALLVAALYGWLCPARWRGWILMILSVVAVYWLSPSLTIRYLDFVLPTLTLALTVGVWWYSRPPDATLQREDRITLSVLVGLVLALSATRYLAPALRPTPSRAPDLLFVGGMLFICGGVIAALARFMPRRRSVLTGVILFLLVLFVIVKAELLALAAGRVLRNLTGQNPDLVRVTDVTWLGFSYVAFRLIHLLRDRQTGRLPVLSLREALTYVLFFPAFTAGPIDRAERFLADYQQLAVLRGADPDRLVRGVGRIVSGLLKKFVVADSLALVALNAVNATQIADTGSAWVLLYGYAFRLFFDFSGYSDIAIGIGYLFGIFLPENFDRPYLKSNIAAFWQSWHITLSNWVRFYVFSPLSRFMLTRKPRPAPLLVVFAAQLATMLAIGLWHGVTWGFAIWGLWHGIGLFIHKVWSDRTRRWYISLREKPRMKRAWTAAGVVLTFQFVVIGWVWFALPDVATAWRIFRLLFGMGV